MSELLSLGEVVMVRVILHDVPTSWLFTRGMCCHICRNTRQKFRFMFRLAAYAGIFRLVPVCEVQNWTRNVRHVCLSLRGVCVRACVCVFADDCIRSPLLSPHLLTFVAGIWFILRAALCASNRQARLTTLSQTRTERFISDTLSDICATVVFLQNISS